MYDMRLRGCQKRAKNYKVVCVHDDRLRLGELERDPLVNSLYIAIYSILHTRMYVRSHIGVHNLESERTI